MSRLTRHSLSTTPPAADMARPGNFCKFAAGDYAKCIVVDERGRIIIDPCAYADDVAAFVLGCVRSNPTIEPGIKRKLAEFVDDMDARAVKRHGYSKSAEEKNFVWTSVAATLPDDK